MFNEVYTIYLYHVYFGSKLNAFNLFTSDNRSNITLCNADDPVRNSLFGLENLLLLRQHLTYHSFLCVVLLREFDPDSVLILNFFLFFNESIQQIQQASGPLDCQGSGLLSHSHKGEVFFFLFRYFVLGVGIFRCLRVSLSWPCIHSTHSHKSFTSDG